MLDHLLYMIAKSFRFKLICKQASIAIGMVVALVSPSIADVVEIKRFGHSSFLVRGGGHSILLNPFKAVGCAKGLREPNVIPDIVVASGVAVTVGSGKTMVIDVLQIGDL